VRLFLCSHATSSAQAPATHSVKHGAKLVLNFGSMTGAPSLALRAYGANARFDRRRSRAP